MGRKSAIAAMVITAIIWSMGGMLIKMVSGNPIAIAGGRAGLAAVVMVVYCRFKFEKVSCNIAIGIILYSFTVIGFVAANKLTTSANAIFLQYTAPIWTAIFSRIFLKTHIRISDSVTIFILLGGMLLFFAGKVDGGMLGGNLLALLTGVSFAGFIVTLKTLNKGKAIYPIMYGNILTFLIGIPFYTRELLHSGSIVGILTLGLIQVGLAYILYSRAIEHLTALDGIIIPVLEPILNPIWVALTIGERPGRYAILGGAIIILAIVIRSVYQGKLCFGSLQKKLMRPYNRNGFNS